MKVKLNQIIAVEKGAKERTHKEFTAIYQGLSKTEPMQGISRTYQPIAEDGEKLPAEHKYVQINVNERLERVQEILIDLFDVTLTKEEGNTRARGTVSVDGTVIVKDVPVSYLLFLEKQLTDLRAVIAALPKLDPADKWDWDEQQGFFKSAEVRTARTKKMTEFVVVQGSGVPDKGVAPQVKEVTNDVLVGYWSTVKYSATMEPTRIAELLERTEKLLRAVKFAREEANGLEIDQAKAGSAVFGYIFSK
jgi:hypothetical protein